MLPTLSRFPWDVLEFETHNMKHESKDGGKFIFAFALPSEVSEPVMWKLLMLCQTFGAP